jgi:hypothetical protein
MAYYIFVKSLRSLEEFRKNPHVKIPPKSSPTNFQSHCIFKIHFLFEKNFFSEFGPPGPASPVLAYSAPQAATRARSAHPGLGGLGVIAKSCLYFKFAQPCDDAFSLSHRQAGCTRQIHLLPPCTARPPSLDANQSPLLPALIPPLNPC